MTKVGKYGIMRLMNKLVHSIFTLSLAVIFVVSSLVAMFGAGKMVDQVLRKRWWLFYPTIVVLLMATVVNLLWSWY